MAFRLGTILLVALSLCACKSKSETGAGAVPSASAPRLVHDVNGVFGSYEGLRALLAQDRSEGLAAQATALAERARAASGQAAGEQKATLELLATAAVELGAKAGEIEAARKSFGEVSRHAVALAVLDPKLREGRFVFECPMAEGYKKWVQEKAELENPYMGAKMLECGAPTEWRS